MALTGDFRETLFADLIQFYGMSKQSVAVVVRLGAAAGDPDGVFYFDRGDLVAARLAGAEGRDALRRALRLRHGTFTVATDVKVPQSAVREPWNRVVMEELVRLDEEERALRARPERAAGATATGPAVAPAPPPAGRAAPAPPTSAGPGAASAPLAASPPPAEPRPSGRPGAPGSAPPPREAPGGGRSGMVRVLLAGGAAALVLGTAVFLLLSKPERRDAALEKLVAAASDVRGVSADEIVFGMVSPFTGANRELGRGMKDGIETAFAALNAAGGIHGRKLRLVALDDGYEPSRTESVMRQLVETEKVFAVVGNVGTPTAAVSIPYCTERKVVFFGALSGGDLLRKSPPDRYVFNFRPAYSEETAAAVRWLVDVRRVPPGRIALFAQEDEFGESGARGALRQLGEYGVDPRSIVRASYRRNTAEVEDAIATLRQRTGSIDAVVMVATYKAAATFVRRARDAGLSFVVTNVSAVDANALAEELVESGARYAKDVVVTQIVPLPTSKASAVMRYQQALAQHGPGERPGFLTLEGWIVGNVLAEGLRRAGRDLDGEKLVEALEGIRDLDLGIGAPVSFGPREHQGSHKVWGTLLQPDGSWRPIDLD